MAALDEGAWADALSMYARRLTIAKVTSREHEDWALDVGTLMRGDVPDARGWHVNDCFAEEFERLDNPYYPFLEVPVDGERADTFKSRVSEIPRTSARRLLVALSTLWLNVGKDPDFEERRAGLEEKADVILSRFPEGAVFYANTGRDSRSPDYYQRISGCSTVSSYDWDLGFVLVSGTEVGMVWSFDPK
ncbi:hypothetical protein ACIPJS_20925 [Streptomyces sp. NPDC086783]|uniref:hypothetical protein n=1 Tax=Streptomyces sp. NPDC086783 TaxID=3365758 RepID=UPI003800DA3B